MKNKLVLKNGTKYHGEFLRTDSKYDKYIPMVYFGPKNEESLRIVPVLGVERLQLKDGIFVINDGNSAIFPNKPSNSTSSAFFFPSSKPSLKFKR